MLNESTLREFYEHVYPVDLITRWLSYSVSAEDSSGAADSGYLARREFCFTLIGDVFTRFRSYSSAAELKAELIRTFPEKIDVGAVYNIRPSQKQGVTINNIYTVERELVFDIDMSDYDAVRSCCTGKSICRHCWPWMSCAAKVLQTVLHDDFGFRHILPVFSGRRGIHLWVCDKAARVLTDDERAAIVGYLTVVDPKNTRSSVMADLANHRTIHPTVAHVVRECIEPFFIPLFLQSTAENPNNVSVNPKAAAVLYNATVDVLKRGRREALTRFEQQCAVRPGEDVLDPAAYIRALGGETDARDVLGAVQLQLMYPRLDEHVSTRRDHLLKLPFCVHPATGALCCPLEWDQLAAFDPTRDAPSLSQMLLDRAISDKWKQPLVRMLTVMSDEAKAAQEA